MKQYAILNREDHSPLIVSTNSHQFAELTHLGYTIVFSGNKKECQEIMMETEDLSC